MVSESIEWQTAMLRSDAVYTSTQHRLIQSVIQAVRMIVVAAAMLHEEQCHCLPHKQRPAVSTVPCLFGQDYGKQHTLFFLARVFTSLVTADLSPSIWLPPSIVLMLLANPTRVSEKMSAAHCKATSTSTPSADAVSRAGSCRA